VLEDRCTEWCIGLRRLIQINKINCPWCEFVSVDTNGLFTHIAHATKNLINDHNQISLGQEKAFVSVINIAFVSVNNKLN